MLRQQQLKCKVNVIGNSYELVDINTGSRVYMEPGIYASKANEFIIRSIQQYGSQVFTQSGGNLLTLRGIVTPCGKTIKHDMRTKTNRKIETKALRITVYSFGYEELRREYLG